MIKNLFIIFAAILCCNVMKAQNAFSIPDDRVVYNAAAAISGAASNAAVVNDVPSCATNISPAHGSVVSNSSSVTLTWLAAANVSSADVYVWSGSSFPAKPTATVNGSTYTVTGLSPATTYFWYVVPQNSSGSAAGCVSTQTSFTTPADNIPPPSCTGNLSPANGATVAAATTASLSWTTAANATSYDVYIWASNVSAPSTPSANTTSTSYNASGLTASTTYYWYVVPKNAAGSATGCINNKTSFITNSGVVPPSCTSNLSPANGAVLTTANSATLTWSAVATATSYDVYIWVNGSAVPSVPVSNTTGTSYTASGLTSLTTYYWYVVPKNTAGAATGCISNKTYFSTCSGAVPPSCTSNLSPANGAVLTTANSATLTWSAVATATSYDVYIWVNGSAVPSVPVSNTTGTSYTASGLTSLTTYYWYVVPKNAAGAATGCISNKTYFSTCSGAVPPSCTSNLSPANGAVLTTANSATLTWSAVATATSYDVYIWVNGSAVPSVPVSNTTGTSYTASGLTSLTTYYWYVVPKNTAGAATGCISNKTYFSTCSGAVPPSCTSNLSPANGAVLTTANSATLTWSAVATATSYDVYIWVNGSAVPSVPVSNTTGTSYTASGLTSLTTYYWYVVPKNTAGAATGCISNKTYFSTCSGAVPPSCTSNLSPANGAVLTTANSATLTWSAVATATSYDVYIWVNGSAVPSVPVSNTTGTSYTASGLTSLTTYYWYVVPKNAAGAATGCISNKTYFSTCSGVVPPSCTSNLSPANGAVLTTANSATLTWSAVATATSYDVYIWAVGSTIPSAPVTNTSSTSYTVNGLAGTTSYYWYISPRNAAGAATGCMNNVTYFSTCSAVVTPSCASNLSPANGAVLGTSSSATLSWSAVATATSYDVYIWVAGGAVPSAPLANTSSTSYTVNGLASSTAYYWYISPRNAAGPATGCVNNKTYFSTCTATVTPYCTSNLSPSNGSLLGTSGTATLTWSAVANATAYDVYIWANNSTIPSVPVVTTAGVSYTVTGLAASTTYNWYVSPRNASAVASGCINNRTCFTTANNSSGCGYIYTSPANGCVYPIRTSIILSWSAVPGAASYDVYLGYGSASGCTYIGNTTATGGAVNCDYSFCPGTYCWYIIPKNAARQPLGCASVISCFNISGSYYYGRVMSMDMQKVVLSPVSEVSATAVAKTNRLYPNPVTKGLPATLQINSNMGGTAIVQVVSTTGAIVKSIQLAVSSGSNIKTISTSDLVPGNYVIRITGGVSEASTFKLVVQ